MENSKEKSKSNIAVIVILSILVFLLLISTTVLLVNSTKDSSISLNGKASTPQEYSSTQKPIENIPTNNTLYLNNNVEENTPTIPDTYGGSNFVKDVQLFSLNNKLRKVEITCNYSVIEKNDNYTSYNTMYRLTLDGKECNGISDSISLLSDSPVPADCFAIKKIVDTQSSEEYLVLQIFSNIISGTSSKIYVINDKLEILGTVDHDGRTIFIIDGVPQELTITSNSIFNYTWNLEQDGKAGNSVDFHIYDITNGKFVDTIERTYKDGEYEAAGAT